MSESLVLEPVEMAATRWEFHVHACTFCLSTGNELCFEGQYLAEDVAEARDDAQRAELTSEPSEGPTARRPIFTARRRPALREAVV